MSTFGRHVVVVSPDPTSARATARDVQRQIGKAVARLRRARQLTQVALAKKIGVAVQYVQRVEGGQQNLTVASLVKFANALKVEPAHLFTKSAE